MDKAGRIAWTDIVTLGELELPAGKRRADLLGRFHVREIVAGPGQLPGPASGPGFPDPSARPSVDWLVGVDAFARIWRELPAFRHLAWVFSVPGIRQAAELAYLAFVRWQARRREARAHKRAV
jgi:hypothetical protein